MYAYLFKINECEQQYQQALNEIELNFTFSNIMINGLTLFHAVKVYMIHQTDCIKQEIHDKIMHFHQIITRHCQHSSLAKKPLVCLHK
jgi:hypothetical protein